MSKPAVLTELKVIVRSPFQLHYEGDASSVSAQNQVGPFDILPGHANFFSILSPCQVRIDSGAEPILIDVSNGIMTAYEDEVLLFINM